MNKGDWIEIEFTGKVALTGEVFDLTSEEKAKESGVYDKDHKYGPALVVLGEKMVIPGVEKELEKMNVGEEKEFNVKPEQAFGPRDPNLIKILGLGKFLEKNINPVPGIFIDIDGMPARIKSVSGGRVTVDFNHALAGKELNYKIKILREIKEPLEKSRLLLKHYGIENEVKLEADVLKIQGKVDEKLMEFIKTRIMRLINEIKEVKFE